MWSWNWLCRRRVLIFLLCRSFIDRWDSGKALINFIIHRIKFFLIENKLTIDTFLIFYKKFWYDLVKSFTSNSIKIFIIYLLNKLHHVFTVAESSLKNFKLQMLLFDFFNEAWEQCLHVLNKLSKLRCSCIRVFIDYVVEFVPWHFLAILVKQATFSSIMHSFLAYKSRFFAVWIHTKYNTLIPVNTFRMFFNLSWHSLYL